MTLASGQRKLRFLITLWRGQKSLTSGCGHRASDVIGFGLFLLRRPYRRLEEGEDKLYLFTSGYADAGSGQSFAMIGCHADTTFRRDNPGEGGEGIPDWCIRSQAEGKRQGVFES